MSRIVLLDQHGAVVRTLQFVTLPDDYVVPEGMTVSWRSQISGSPNSSCAAQRRSEMPNEAYFSLGNAHGQVSWSRMPSFCDPWDRRFGNGRFGFWTWTITVQGTSAQDVMRLRERILQLVPNGKWGASNDLNLNPPKPGLGFVGRLLQLFGWQQPAA